MSTPDPFGGRRYNPNTPEGQIQSVGMFARAIGARPIKIAMLVLTILVAIMILAAVL
jgi:hypothetical protein